MRLGVGGEAYLGSVSALFVGKIGSPSVVFEKLVAIFQTKWGPFRWTHGTIYVVFKIVMNCRRRRLSTFFFC